MNLGRKHKKSHKKTHRKRSGSADNIQLNKYSDELANGDKDDDKSIPTSLPPDVKTIPARDVDRNEYTGDWRTGKVWRPPRDANLPKFKVDLGKGTVTIVDEEEERKKYARMRAMNAAAADAAKAVRDPILAAHLQAYLAWSGGDPQGALLGAEEVIADHGATPSLLALVVDLALVVGADRLAEARLQDLERASVSAPGSTVDPAVLQRLAGEVDRAAARRSVASGALVRARAVVAAAAALLGVAVFGVWRFLRAPLSPLAAS